MTVSYSRLVANGSSFGCFWSILRKWKGSVYKLVWRELIVYMFLYFAINATYQYVMNDTQQKIFQQIRSYFKGKSQSIPMSFVLGFYVTLVVKRWWEQYRLLPWPDTLALFVSAAIPGADERGRLMRRTIVRYAVLAYIITLKHVSVRVKKRFPTLQHIVDAGFMMESEKKIVEMMDERSPMSKYWMPLVWATNIINRARKDSLISSDHIVQTLLVELSEIRRRLGAVISYDTVCVPLVYTQILLQFMYQYLQVPSGKIIYNQQNLYVLITRTKLFFEAKIMYLLSSNDDAISTFIGFLMESEKKIFEMLEAKTPMTKYWLPLTWATNIINRARKELLITNDHMVQTILLEMSDLRSRLGSLIGYDNVNIPIVYTQVVTLSVYTYFLAALIGAQMIPLPDDAINKKPEDVNLYFPVITVLEFGFYIGWLKVAEVLIGPFGEDDDDIELNWLIDRHIKAAYMIVDEMHEEHPELLKDQYWDEVVPKDLPYTVGSEHYRKEEPKGSAEFYKVKDADALYANVSSNRRKSMIPDDVYADYESVDTPVVERRKNWFQRQITRMGSVRSSSTTYSSGGLFRTTNQNSMYSSPDTTVHPVNSAISATIITNGNNTSTSVPSNYSNHKISFYDRLVGRRSTRVGKLRQGIAKMNGSVTTNLKNRPRIPTPDATRESFDVKHSHPTTVAAPSANYGNELPVVQVVLSPIQEMEGLSANGNSVSVSTSGASALAQAVLTPALKTVGLNNVSTVTMAVNPVTLSTVPFSQQLFSATAAPNMSQPNNSVVLTDVTYTTDKDDNLFENNSNLSVSSDEKSRKISLPSQKRGEVYV